VSLWRRTWQAPKSAILPACGRYAGALNEIRADDLAAAQSSLSRVMRRKSSAISRRYSTPRSAGVSSKS
jgi:hypothetical protein